MGVSEAFLVRTIVAASQNQMSNHAVCVIVGLRRVEIRTVFHHFDPRFINRAFGANGSGTNLHARIAGALQNVSNQRNGWMSAMIKRQDGLHPTETPNGQCEV